ncbi:fluoride efflux transporter CrcB [Lysobacter enzymogenes]|uniref:fluoride efflux transporter CrcB n=1 Tax=Lysobacter enzymogenes TaxID=69 RepID=UPI00099BB91D|nr:fluoride efflux transporter CrcB [Lysobacter enzymogenes]UZW63236.1 fluoride efflux transporter CrcB [Lysobacter enzymogenes]
MSAVSIFIGAGLGALLRWWLGLALNPLFPTVPMGTLAANALGGLLMGVLMAVFAQYETLPLALRLALTTGFLGGLTTFSTFSAETSSLLLRGEYGWAGAIVAAHVGASLLATLAGVMAVRGLFRWLAGAAA